LMTRLFYFALKLFMQFPSLSKAMPNPALKPTRLRRSA
jgi:hypothetical protein